MTFYHNDSSIKLDFSPVPRNIPRMGNHTIALPERWPAHVKSALVHVVSMAHTAMVYSRAFCENDWRERVRLRGQVDTLRAEVAMLREELRITATRTERITPAKRPHFPPEERLAILLLRAARGWSVRRAAEAFFVSPGTIRNWLRCLERDGEQALIKPRFAANRFPDFVRLVVQQMRASFPLMGRKKIAQTLARAGLAVAASTVRSISREKPVPPPRLPPPTPRPLTEAGRTVVANYPHHVHHVDVTVVPTTGLWVPWMPWSLPVIWPFAWHVVAIVDQYSRAVMAIGAFRRNPTTAQVTELFEQAIVAAGRTPKYIISDQGLQFREEFREWCEEHRIRHRKGALGKHGSIAIIERFFRTLKTELFAVVRAPTNRIKLDALLGSYIRWYNTERVHSGIGGAAPIDRLKPEAVEPIVRFETRPRCSNARASPGVVRPVKRLRLVVDRFEGQPHLRVVRLDDAA